MFEPRQFPFPKRVLLRIHRDLATIVRPFEGYHRSDLSDIEVIIILLEDRNFPEHRGIDFKSILRELLKMCTLRRFGGASTIDMQFVRTMTGFKQKTLRRKLYEMFLAYLLQFHMSKLAILRCYLEVVYLGSGLQGIRSAARTVFEKEVSELAIDEAAQIAAMMVYPKPLNPTAAWTRNVQRRAAYGLRLFRKLGHRYKQRFD